MSKRTVILAVCAALIILGVVIGIILPRTGDGPVTLRFSSGQDGGVYQPLAGGIRDAIGRRHPHITLNISPSEGSDENIKRLLAGQTDLTIVENSYEPDARLRTLTPLYVEVMHILKHRSVDIQAIDDFRGKRIAVGNKGSGTERLVGMLLSHYALDYEDFQPHFLSASDAADALVKGDIDAMLFVSGLKSEVCQRAIDSGRVAFVSLGDPADAWGEIEGLKLEYPFIERSVIPRYAYGSNDDGVVGEPRQPIVTVGVRALLVGRRDLDDAVAEAVVESIFENRADLVKAHRVASQLREHFEPATLQFPIHPGADRYFRRAEPGFLETYAESMGFVLSIIVTLAAIFTGIRTWYTQLQKDRIDKYYGLLGELSDRIDQRENDLATLNQLHDELTAVRRRAFDDLINEKILANDSFQIFQTLLADCQRRIEARLELTMQKA